MRLQVRSLASLSGLGSGVAMSCGAGHRRGSDLALPSFISPQIANAGESAEKREPSCTAGGNVNWYSHYGEQFGDTLEIYP